MQPESEFEKLVYWRKRIDETDLQILTLLNERTRIVEEVARVKGQLDLPVFQRIREEQVLANATSRNTGPLPDDAVNLVFERIIGEMRAFEAARLEEPGGEVRGKRKSC